MDILPVIIVTSSAATTLGLVAAFTAGWHAGRRSLARRDDAPPAMEDHTVASRISIADLRVRMQRLEAIAAGIDV